MSRTRHHGKVTASEQAKRKKVSLRQRYTLDVPVDDWYIELPITKQIGNRLSRREKAWG